MSPLGLSGGVQWISRTLAPAAFTVGGSRPSGAASKVRTETPSPTPHPSTKATSLSLKHTKTIKIFLPTADISNWQTLTKLTSLHSDVIVGKRLQTSHREVQVLCSVVFYGSVASGIQQDVVFYKLAAAQLCCGNGEEQTL